MTATLTPRRSATVTVLPTREVPRDTPGEPSTSPNVEADSSEDFRYLGPYMGDSDKDVVDDDLGDDEELDDFDDIDEDDFDDDFDDDFEEELEDDYEIEIDDEISIEFGLTTGDPVEEDEEDLVDDFEDFEAID